MADMIPRRGVMKIQQKIYHRRAKLRREIKRVSGKNTKIILSSRGCQKDQTGQQKPRRRKYTTDRHCDRLPILSKFISKSINPLWNGRFKTILSTNRSADLTDLSHTQRKKHIENIIRDKKKRFFNTLKLVERQAVHLLETVKVPPKDRKGSFFYDMYS